MARREITGRRPGVSVDLVERKSGSPEPDGDELDDDEADGDQPDAAEADDDEPTKHDEAATQAPPKLPPIRGPPRHLALKTAARTCSNPNMFDDADAYTIEEFCRRHRLSIALFYKHPRLMPNTFYVGSRRLVSRESAARWRAEREAAGGVR